VIRRRCIAVVGQGRRVISVRKITANLLRLTCTPIDRVNGGFFMIKLHGYAALLAIPVLSACGFGYSIENIDKPAPRSYEGWVKPGAGLLDVKKALLECGAPHYDLDSNTWAAIGVTDDAERMSRSFLVDRCMENGGFIDRWGDTVKKYCSWDRHKHLPACQPGAVIPQRSVERRLNSWLCKLKTDREYCRKHALTPNACDDPKKDYNDPPPECRP
jgi:hypothetical protein